MKTLYTTLATALLSFMAFGQAPVLMQDLNPGTANFGPSNLTVYNGNLYFSGDDTSGVSSGGVDLGRELWISNGLAGGSSVLRDINPGAGNSNPLALFIFNNFLYFTGNDGSASLWRTDGTTAGTVIVDLIPGQTGESPINPTVFGNSVFFTALVNGAPNQLVEWDGTNAGVLAVDAVNPTAVTNVTALTVFNNLLFLYMTYSPESATVGRELYSYNPATNVYTLIKDITTGTGNSGVGDFTPLGNTLYFEAEGNLWQTDGTTAGTIEVPAAATLGMNGVVSLFAYNNYILFEGDNGSGDQLWALDTTTGTIAQVSTNTGTNINHDPTDYVIYNNLVYYRGEDSNDTNGNLFVTNGVTTTQLDNTVINLDDLVIFNDKIYFEGSIAGVTGNEVFFYDLATASIGSVNTPAITLYPNPAREQVFISNNNNNQVNYFVIYDLTGRSMRRGKIQNNSIPVDLSPGIYIVELKGNQTSVSQKLIIE